VHFVCDEIDFQPVVDPRLLDRLRADVQTDNFFQRKDMNPAQVVVGIRRRKPVQMRSADRREQQRIRVLVELSLESRVHIQSSCAASMPFVNEWFSSPQKSQRGTWLRNQRNLTADDADTRGCSRVTP
jgi:hypothetical protein